MLFSRKQSPWEVVDHRAVQPVPYYPDDDLDILNISDTDMQGTYVFDMKEDAQHDQQALVFARQQLLKEISKRGYNALVLEGWQMTVFRRGAKRRVQIQYLVRPALTSRDIPPRLPPFFELLTSTAY